MKISQDESERSRRGLLRRSIMDAFIKPCAALLASLALASGASAFEPWEQRIDRPDHDIVILHTNDVHCAIDENIGYAGLASYRNEMLRETPYVVLVDCGDFVQGAVIGAISSGDCIIDIMNATSYDLAICGNHEFDYGIPRLAELMRKSSADLLGVNIHYLGGDASPLPKLKPYRIMSFGETKVAFIGVTTPDSITSSTPTNFMRDGRYIWNFRGGSPKEFYRDIQSAVEECRISGADYVILMTHVGDGEAFGPFASPEIARNTWGIDAIIDGHQHSMIPSRYERSLTGKPVPISSAETQLKYIGRVVITPDGGVYSGLISSWPDRDAMVAARIDEIKAQYESTLSQVVARTDAALLDSVGGVRTVRSRETPLASLVADAYRVSAGADIGLCNGGVVRASLPAGDVTIADLIAVDPFGNSVVAVKATGRQVIDALEWGAQHTEREFSDGKNEIGAFGGFLQVSNIKYTIDTSVRSTVQSDANGIFTGVGGARRVSDVQVLRANGWEPIDPDAIYTVASHSYLMKAGGDGNAVFTECELTIDSGAADYMAILEYIRDVLRGDLSSYAAPEGRITVR